MTFEDDKAECLRLRREYLNTSSAAHVCKSAFDKSHDGLMNYFKPGMKVNTVRLGAGVVTEVQPSIIWVRCDLGVAGWSPFDLMLVDE